MPSIYLNEFLMQVPRLLGLLDRNPSTKTYGCFDREFWHYHTTDTPCARKQEAVLSLALLYKIKHKNNNYHNNPKILEWINASLDFWTSIQLKNGSFNEWYPNEHSFVATAFSSYAISETLLVLKDKINSKDKIISSLKKAGDWLMKKSELRVQNQQAGAAISLLNLYLLTKEKKYLINSEKKVSQLIKNQDQEGWWFEYSGPDIGYLSLTIDYLSKYYKKHPNTKLKKSINKAMEFTSYFLHPDFTAGGCYASRNTEYIIPSGFEIMNSSPTSFFIRNALKNNKIVSPSSLDDRYLSYIGYNWLQAFINVSAIKNKKQKYEKEFTKDFNNAKIYIKSTPCYYLILNYNKGAFKVFFKKTKKSYIDSGILIETTKDNYIAGLADSVKKTSFKQDIIILEGNLKHLSKSLFEPYKNIALRTFQTTIGKSESISFFVKNKLRNKLITKSKSSPIPFTRTILFNKNSIKVIDKTNITAFNKIITGEKFSYLYVPSSNYFQMSEIESSTLKKIVKKTNTLEVTRTLL